MDESEAFPADSLRTLRELVEEGIEEIVERWFPVDGADAEELVLIADQRLRHEKRRKVPDLPPRNRLAEAVSSMS